jgi:anti-sigma regulatory factor (Ser/Thr protein kinase)
MNTMAPTCPTELQSRRIWLATGAAAVPEARGHVRAAICSWDVPVDEETAVLLTSELVTNAIRHDPRQAAMLVIACFRDQLRVDVHDASRSFPVVADVPADAETGRGLLLVATLSAEWGFYRTAAGKAVYFTLAGLPEPVPAGLQIPRQARK